MKKKIIFKNIEDLPVKVTDWIGSTSSIVVHTIFFIVIFALRLFGVATSDILLILTTVVSLEAIYLAILIQMTVNRNTLSLQEVEEDIDEIQEDVQVIEKDIDEIQEDIDEIQEDEEETQKTDKKQEELILTIEATMRKLVQDIEALRQKK
jgi:peptidoglycan hydrolase CwlO-like protein